MQVSKIFHPERLAFWYSVAMLAMVAAPVGITLTRINVSPFRPLSELIKENPSPQGYTWSLLIFVVPILLISIWFLPKDGVRISKKALWRTIAVLFPIGICLDFFFAKFFLQFPNSGSVSGILAPALGAWVPIEEYIFYFTGFLAVLLFYIWLDGYWLHAYSVPDCDQQRVSFHRLMGFHPDSLVLAAVLIVAGIIYKVFAPTRSPGFPGYFIFLVLSSLLPSVVLFRAVKKTINWRALSLTLFIIVLVSILWESTLAVPFGWWNYQHFEMVGIYVLAWDCLPVEAILVWIAVTYMTVIVYEAIRTWQASGKPVSHAFFGESPSHSPSKVAK